MKYFAYGSNMSLARLRARVPSAKKLGVYFITQHALIFHKVGKDGSAKCDAFETKAANDKVHGVLFEISEADKPILDFVEDLGHGYQEKQVRVQSACGQSHQAFIYYAILVSPNIKPYAWYLHHVVVGAKENALPAPYIEKLSSTDHIEDENLARVEKERAIYAIRKPFI